MGVGVSVAVLVGVMLGVRVGVCVGVRLGVRVTVLVGVLLGVCEGVVVGAFVHGVPEGHPVRLGAGRYGTGLFIDDAGIAAVSVGAGSMRRTAEKRAHAGHSKIKQSSRPAMETRIHTCFLVRPKYSATGPCFILVPSWLH